jgi:AcrR family transcriptional regulator
MEPGLAVSPRRRVMGVAHSELSPAERAFRPIAFDRMAQETGRARRPGRQRTDGRTRRDELLDIAARVFATRGIASATVRDIAQEAGILSGSLYHHFESKEEMVREIIAPAADQESHSAIAAAAATPTEALRECILTAVRWVAKHPDVARILRNDAQYIKETPALAETERRRQGGRLVWISIVEEGMKDGTFRQGLDPDVAVRAMWDGVLASIRWFPPLGHADPELIGAELADLYLGGVSAPRRSTPRRKSAATSG